MHYRNGREAKNGDKVVQLSFNGGQVVALGVLHSATPGQDYYNGLIAPTQAVQQGACLIDCLHIDDIEKVLVEAGLDCRPEGK